MEQPDLDRLSAGKYLRLTTYRKDGTPVPTPVWVTREGDRLYVITGAESGKVKRLRANPEVGLAPCDVRGNPSGPQVVGRARLLDAAGTRHVVDLVNRRYGLLARVLGLRERLRRSDSGQVGLEISLT